MSCNCTTTDGKNVTAAPYMVKWCGFFKDMLEGVGVDENDTTVVEILCDSKMFQFVDEFCKFYDLDPYEYQLVNSTLPDGKTRGADFISGFPVIKFSPLYTMVKNAYNNDTATYARRKSAWLWLISALESSEYFSCQPLTTEISRSLAYLVTGMDTSATQKITGVAIEEIESITENIIVEMGHGNNHAEIFDDIYKSITAPPDNINTNLVN
jgi:hypothetical protein